jgi:Mitochondrial protein Pet127
LPHQFYHYSVADSFLLRAQIDCKDDVTGSVFDVKTRAVAPIRYDLHNYLSNTHRVLHRLTGLRDSYEREFYDMVRSVFLKYALQLRIGRMSGAFVAYHNTSKMLGFEFVTLEEIEAYVFGSKTWTEQAFSSTIRLLGLILDEITIAMPVSYPDYLKVVIAVHYSQRCVHIYAQRVRASETDPLGAEKFESIAIARSQRRRSTNSQDFDVDSQDGVNGLESPVSRRGVSFVASDSIGTDMDKLASISRLAASGCTNIANVFDPKVIAESELLKCTTLAPGDLCAWELSLAHFVNDTRILEPIELHSGDKFELRYRLERKPLDDSQILKNYIGVLSNAYYPNSAN